MGCRVRILYRDTPAWEVGANTLDVVKGSHYPDDYAGKVISAVPEGHRFTKADLADPRRKVAALDLDDEVLAEVRSRRAKITGGRLEPVTFDDRWGAVAETLRENFVDVEKVEAEQHDYLSWEGRRFAAVVGIAEDGLPEMVTHSGAGLYEVGSGKTYSTIQSALDQLWTDQGAAAFIETQYIRIFAGTYDENVLPNAALDPQEATGFILVIEGDPADDRGNIIVSPSAGGQCLYVNCDSCLVRHMKFTGTPTSAMVQFGVGCDQAEVSDCVISGAVNCVISTTTRSLRVFDCEITQTGAAKVAVNMWRGGHVAGCTLTGDGSYYAIYTGTNEGFGIYDCTFSGWVAPTRSATDRFTHGRFVNNTVYNCLRGLSLAGFNTHVVVVNNIFKDCTNVFYITAKPQEASGVLGGRFYLRNNCYHGYTNFTDDGDTYAQFAAYNRVDASGDLDATDPLLTNPGAGDFSLQAASPCRFAGHGSGTLVGVNGVARDPSYPDIGAWSSGPASTSTVSITDVTTAVSTVTVSATVTVAPRINAKLIDNAGATIDEQSRTGFGDIALTLSAAPRHFLMVWASNGVGDIIDVPVVHSATIFNTAAGSTTFNAVRSLLDQGLREYQATNVVYENAEYEPTLGTGYLRATFMPGEPEQAALGTEGENRLVGIYQVSVFEPTGEGAGPAETVAQGLVAAFKRGSSFESGDVTVRVQKVWRGVAVQEKDWYHIPVSVMWFAYTAN